MAYTTKVKELLDVIEEQKRVKTTKKTTTKPASNLKKS